MVEAVNIVANLSDIVFRTLYKNDYISKQMLLEAVKEFEEAKIQPLNEQPHPF